jgi:hypothetical protein
MGDSLEYRDDQPAEHQPSTPISIGRLLVYACMLLFAALAMGLVLLLTQKDQERRVVRASELAQDRLERLVAERRTMQAGSLELPDEEVIVSPGGRERYSRVVAIDPPGPVDGPARLTVTVAWDTFIGENHVKMCCWLDVREAPEP